MGIGGLAQIARLTLEVPPANRDAHLPVVRDLPAILGRRGRLFC